MDYAKESLRLHYDWKGKLEMVNRAPVDSAEALSLAYTPGVAAPCLEIQKDVDKSYELTRRWNTVAVVTDGTAVLGLGDIGPEAGMPVMEGKCVLFKAFGSILIIYAAIFKHFFSPDGRFLPLNGKFVFVNRRVCLLPPPMGKSHSNALIKMLK